MTSKIHLEALKLQSTQNLEGFAPCLSIFQIFATFYCPLGHNVNCISFFQFQKVKSLIEKE